MSLIDTAATVERYPSREAWLAARRSGIGGSDAAGVLGVAPPTWTSPLKVWAEKRGLAEPEGKPPLRLRLGLLLEPVVLGLYREESGRDAAQAEPYTILRSAERPWQIATLDGTAELDGAPSVVQLKTTAGVHAGEWADGPPLHYQVQTQHEMDVAGVDRATLVCLIGNDRLVWFDCERNPAFVAALREREHEFWRRVERNEPPEIDGSDATAEAIRRLHPLDNGAEVMLPPEADQWDAELAAIKEQLAALESRKQEIDSRLRAAIGDATFGALPSGGRYSLKTVSRKETVVKASTFRTLRRIKQ